MKIAYLLGSLNRGGTETLVLDIYRNAQKNNLNVIGIYRKTGAYERDFVESGVTQYKLPVGRNVFAYLYKLRQLVLNNNIEIVHAQQPIDALYAYFACFGTDRKVILSFHGYDFTINNFGKKILRFIIKKTECNIYVSDSQRKYYENKYSLNPQKQKLVYNGISFKKFEDSLNSKSIITYGNIRKDLKLTSDTILLGAVGNFNEVRDQMTVCRFLNLLNRDNVNFHFVFVGKMIESSKHLYDDCLNFCNQNDLSNKVSFLGSRNDVPTILNELDAFIYSTDHDTFGIAVVEAMYAKIPVFVNDWGVMKEITEEGKFATIFKTKNENDLYQKFMEFLLNKTEFKQKAISANVYVQNKFSIEKHIENLKDLYKTVLQK